MTSYAARCGTDRPLLILIRAVDTMLIQAFRFGAASPRCQRLLLNITKGRS